MRRITTVLGAMAILGAAAVPLRGQQPEPGVDAYFRAVAEYFRLPESEVEILHDWRLLAEEIPVALFVASRAGVSPEALVALRRRGASWSDLAARYRVGADVFYVPLRAGAPAGPLEALYARFRETSPTQWSALPLSDEEIVALVNVRVIAQSTGRDPSEVLRRAADARSYVDVYNRIIR